jgi:hypothetical protein
MAAATPDPGLRQHQLRCANDYMDLAMCFPDDGYVPPGAPVSDAQQPTEKLPPLNPSEKPENKE